MRIGRHRGRVPIGLPTLTVRVRGRILPILAGSVRGRVLWVPPGGVRGRVPRRRRESTVRRKPAGGRGLRNRWIGGAPGRAAVWGGLRVTAVRAGRRMGARQIGDALMLSALRIGNAVALSAFRKGNAIGLWAVPITRSGWPGPTPVRMGRADLCPGFRSGGPTGRFLRLRP
ncbi:hypothetical protein Mame01_29260 [Microbispora amethystogenes]|nr:hypothetical protein Mame01_29260 [Microbispora amethystogenes]